MALASQEKPLSDEIDAIRRELSSLMLQMPTTSLESSSSLLDPVNDDGNDMYTQNVVVSQSSLGQLVGRVEREREKRQKLEEELRALRGDFATRAVGSFESKEKDEELARLTRERNELQMWLQRGVSECRRVAEEAMQLKKDLNECAQRCKSLEMTRDDLQAKVDAAQQQLEETRSQVERLQEKEKMLETCAGEHAFSAEKMEDMHQQQQKDYERLLTEAGTLRRRVSVLEEAEMCVQLLTERMQQLQMHISLLGQAVRRGDVESVSPEELFVQEVVTEPRRPLQELIVRSKTLLHTLVGAVRELQVDVSKFMAVQHRLYTEQEETHREHIRAMHMEKQAELHKYEMERDTMLGEIARLKAVTARLVTKDFADDPEEVDGMESCVNDIEALLSSNKQLTLERDELSAQNAALQVKLRRLKIDWKKVHESQKRFQELQVEVDMIAQVNEKIKTENEDLKLLMETRFGVQAVQQQHQRQLEGVFKSSASPMLVRPSLSPILKDDLYGSTRCTRSSLSVAKQSSRHLIEREVFQEWKHLALKGCL